MHFPIPSQFIEVAVLAELDVPWVFQNKQAVFMKNICIKYRSWNFVDERKIVWWIGKNNIEFFPAKFQKTKNIIMDYSCIDHVELPGNFPDKANM